MYEQLSFAANGNIMPCPYRDDCFNYSAGCQGLSYWCKRVPDSKKSILRTPCDRYCDVEWCSMVCFKRRGYIWDKTQHSWVCGDNGKAMRAKNRECDWEPKEKE